MAKTQTASFAERYMKSPKLWLTVNFVSTIALSLAILISLIIGGYKAQYMIFPIILLVVDILFLTVSLLSNFRFGYSNVIITLYLLISATLTFLTIYTDGGSGGTKLFTHASIYLFVIFHLIAAVAWGISYAHASSPAIKKLKTGILSAAMGTVLVLACGIYGLSVFNYGWFGQGALGVERTVEYAWNAETGQYDVVGLASDRGDTVIIPESFNGKPVGKIDCAFAADGSITEIYFESKNITTYSLVNPELLLSEDSDRTVHGKIQDDKTMPLQQALLELARVKKDETYLRIVNTVEPYGLAEDQIYVNFAYDFDDLKITDGNFMFLWVGSRGDSVPSSLLRDVPYLRYQYDPADPDNEKNMVWAYENANKSIYTGFDSQTFPGFDEELTESHSGVKFNFEPLFRLHVLEDNDTVYDMNPDFRYHDAERSVPHVFTREQIDPWFAGADKRDGFTLGWRFSRSGSSVKKNLDQSKPLSEQVEDGCSLYPLWTMKTPVISSIGVTPDVVYGESAKFTSAATAASDSFNLSYEWTYNTAVKSTEQSFSIHNVLFSYAGPYTLRVISSSPEITSLVSVSLNSVTLNVTKRALELDWVLPGNPVYTASAKRVRWSISDDVASGTGVINGDNVLLKSNYRDITFVGDYEFAPELSDAASELYYIKVNPTNSFSITPAPLEIVWGSNTLAYNTYDQIPSAYAPGLGSDGYIPLTLTGKIKNVGDSTAKAVIENPNYTLTNPTFSFSIVPREVDIQWTELTHVYDGTSKKPTATSRGVNAESGNTLTFEVSGEKTDAGTYEATVALDSTGNYVARATSAAHSFTVTKRPVTLTWDVAGSVRYKAAAWNYTAKTEGAVEGESITLIYEYDGTESSDTAPRDAGSYSVTAILDPTNGTNKNYVLTSSATGTVTTPITVTRVELNLTWSGTKQTYDTAEKTVKISSLGISGVPSKAITDEATALIEYSGEKNTAAGNYTATAALSSDKNFVIKTGSSYDYEILKRTVTPVWNTAEAEAFVYDGKEKTVYVTLTGIHPSHKVTDVIGYTGQTRTDAGTDYVASIAIINDNYQFASNAQKELTYAIAKRTLSVSWTLTSHDGDLVYDGAQRIYAPTFTGAAEGESPTISFIYRTAASEASIAAPINAGSYKLVASLVAENDTNRNYKLSGEVFDFAITPKPVEVAWGNAEFVFNGNSRKPTATYKDINDGTVYLTVNGAKTNASASPYTATAVCSDSNYRLTNPTKSFTIAPLEVSAVWGSTEFIYNGKAQKPTATYTNVYGNPVALSVSGEMTNASATAYTAIATAADTNYKLTGATAAFTIAPKEVSASWGNATFVFNGKAQKPSATFTDVSGTPVALTVNGEMTDASESAYTAEAVCTDGNYKLVGVTTKNFTISPLEVSTVWANTSLIYNGAAQKPTASFTDALGEVVPLIVTGTGTDASAEPYSASTALDDTNYTLTGTTVSFTVSPKQVTVAWSGVSLTYSGEAQKPSASYTDVHGSPIALTVSGEMTDAGTYTAAAAGTDPNYTLTGYEKSFTINPKPVEVVWGNNEFTYNGSAQKPTASFEDVSGATVILTVSGEMTDARAADYTASASCADKNYMLINPTESFTIAPLAVEVIWGDTEFVYNGELLKPTASFKNVFGDDVTLTVSGEAKDASNTAYTATAATADTNYRLTDPTVQFTISPMQITVAWENTSLTYNGMPQKPTASFTDANGHKAYLTVEGAKTDASAALYTAIARSTDTNYVISGASATHFTISPKTVLVIWTNTSLTYNGTAQKPSASFENVFGTTVALEVSGTGTDASRSSYSATASLEDSNYVLDGSTVSFVISPLEVSLVWSFGSAVYNGARQVPTVTVKDLGGKAVSFANAEVSLTAGDGTSVGTHTATATLDSNFSVANGGTHTYTITQAPVTVIWSTENGIENPTVHGAPSGAYKVTVYVSLGGSWQVYTGSLELPGSYKVTVTLTNDSYKFAIGTETEKVFAVAEVFG